MNGIFVGWFAVATATYLGPSADFNVSAAGSECFVVAEATVCVELAPTPGQDAIEAQSRPAAANDARLLDEFRARVNQYADLHRQLEGPLPPQEVTTDPKQIRAASEALARELKAARPRAQQGEIFTPDVANAFRCLILVALEDQNITDVIASITEETLGPVPKPRVHDPFPWTASTRVPCTVLLKLPPLPKDLEYRFLGRDLILLDIHANLIVDFIPAAIPGS
jgi:hypothetical protein